MKKKIVSVIVCMLASLTITTVAFADDTRAVIPGNYRFISSAMNGEYLNAYTDGVPVAGTRVTTYSYTGHLTQQWIAVRQTTDRYVIEPAAYQPAGTPLVVCNVGNTAYLQPLNNVSIPDRQVKLVDEGNGKTGIALVDRSAPFLALTATEIPMKAGGHSVAWGGSSGLSNQLWR